MSTTDQNISIPTAGQSDWDTDLNANFTIMSRGFHALMVAGDDINTGNIVTVTSDGFARLFDPQSFDNQPQAFAYKAVNSGEEDTFLLRGIVRSLSVLSPAVPGERMFGAADGTGFAVGSYSASNRPIGTAIQEDGLYFSPGDEYLPETLVRSAIATDIIRGPANLVNFDLDGGRGGFVRQLITIGASADLVEIALYANSARSELLFQTVSGGISVVGSFIDQAGFPFYNSEVSTINGLIYGTLELKSLAAVASDTIGLSVVFERNR